MVNSVTITKHVGQYAHGDEGMFVYLAPNVFTDKSRVFTQGIDISPSPSLAH